MLTAAGSALVVGTANTMSKTVQVKVLRAFLIKGEPQKVGATIEVDHVLAAELRHAQKAAIVPAAAPAPKASAPQVPVGKPPAAEK